jgi:hypothetical protein
VTEARRFPPLALSFTTADMLLILVGACGAFVAVLRNHAEIVRAHANRESPKSAALPFPQCSRRDTFSVYTEVPWPYDSFSRREPPAESAG